MNNTRFLCLVIFLCFSFFKTHAQLLINEFYADVAVGLVGDANGDGVRSAREDEFIELVNPTDTSLHLKDFTLWVSNSLRHEFIENTILPAQSAIVIFGGGQPTGLFGSSLVTVASSGLLGLGNSGAKVELKNTDCVNDFYVMVRQNDVLANAAAAAHMPKPISRVVMTASGQEIFDLSAEELLYSKLLCFNLTYDFCKNP